MMVLKERCSYADVYFLYHFSILFYSSSRLLEKNPMFGNSEGRKIKLLMRAVKRLQLALFALTEKL